MDAAYPGTTPWERLGVGNANGGVASAAIGAASQMKLQQQQLGFQSLMQDKELSIRAAIADKQNRITAMGYGSPMGVKAAKQFMDLYDGKYDWAKGGDDMFRKGESDIHRNTYGSTSSAISSGVKGLSPLIDSIQNIPGLLSGSLRADKDIRSSYDRLLSERAKHPDTYNKLRKQHSGKKSFLYN